MSKAKTKTKPKKRKVLKTYKLWGLWIPERNCCWGDEIIAVPFTYSERQLAKANPSWRPVRVTITVEEP